MFNNYRIIDYGSEKVLILYVSSFYEFGIDFKKRNRNNSMKKIIIDIVKKINFTGEKIALMIGGITLATILVVENPKVSDNFDLIYVADNVLPITEVIDNKIKNKPIILENVEEINEVEVRNNEKEINNNFYDQSVNHEVEVKQEAKIVSNDKKNNVITNSEKEEYNPLTVTVYRKNGSVLELELEEYLIGVVGSEMPASFNIEALKAQAVISRTYALKSMEIGRKLTDDVTTQTYKDNSELRKMWGDSYDKYYHKIKDAVFSTSGLAIFYDNKYIDAVFHSTSNGKTEDASYVWKNSVPYLKSVDSSWDVNSSSYLRIEEKDLSNILNILNVNSSDFSIISRNESGRVLEIKVGDNIYSGVEFRNLLGLRSSDFDIEINDNKIMFTTRGYGHGVGLSQYGANGMANDGYNYLSIIKHYYVGVEVK